MIRWNISKKIALTKEEKEVWVKEVLKLRLDVLQHAKCFTTLPKKVLAKMVENEND